MGYLSVHNLGKCYKRYESPWGRLREWAVPGAAVTHSQRWVLRHVDF